VAESDECIRRRPHGSLDVYFSDGTIFIEKVLDFTLLDVNGEISDVDASHPFIEIQLEECLST
jgi:hypothetical protein